MKRVLVVRHAEAEPKKSGQQDSDRRLTRAGTKEAAAVGKGLRVLCEGAVCLMTSQAVRAIETGDALAKKVECEWRIATDALNPGCGPRGWASALAESPKEADTLILVGHEPDLSEMVGRAVGCTNIRLKFKKLGCAVVEWDDSRKAVLAAFLPPKLLVKRGSE